MSITTALQLYSAVIVKSSELWTDVPFRFNEKKANQQCLLDSPAGLWSIKKTTIQTTKGIKNG